MTRANSARTETVEQWAGCYDDGWRDLIVPEAFSHPAKAARGLLVRIFDELFATGALGRDDLVCDPFSGIGTSGIEAASRGCRFVGVELEEKFVRLAEGNFALHAATWAAMGRPQPVIVQGDSRRLRECIGPALAECVVSSPPYELSGGVPQIGQVIKARGTASSKAQKELGMTADYGRSPGQLGAMPAGDVAAIVSSPPYANGALNDSQRTIHRDGLRAGDNEGDGTYGESAGQLARLSEGAMADVFVSSPPYERSMDSIENIEARAARADGFSCGQKTLRYGQNPNTFLSRDPSGLNNAERAEIAARNPQLGAIAGDTFWTAARQIVAESYAILRPGGTAVWIVKSFVRNKQIVDFPGDWRKLCEACGFETVKEVHAMLVAEERRPHLWDGERVTTRERKSFFRRLAESKGSPAINYETVWFMVKR